ncbi:hypothetical protein SH611_20145 [Geminicoccaceae bacterium 1502E]|nr:hypothetical protein [Geminicoccaceae bacterium 1502E]
MPFDRRSLVAWLRRLLRAAWERLLDDRELARLFEDGPTRRLIDREGRALTRLADTQEEAAREELAADPGALTADAGSAAGGLAGSLEILTPRPQRAP